MNFLRKYGINIKNKKLLEQALTHSSYANETKESEDYERLEFLGDAVLQIIISEYIYLNTDMPEGEMTKLRAGYVCENALVEYSKKIDLIPFIKVGQGQSKNLNNTIIADVFESTIGAIYLSNGIKDVKKIINKVVIPYIEEEYTFFDDYKSALQEILQTSKKTLEYVTINESGPPHNKRFIVEVKIDGITYGKGEGKSKKEAEQNAAFDAYKKQAK